MSQKKDKVWEAKDGCKLGGNYGIMTYEDIFTIDYSPPHEWNPKMVKFPLWNATIIGGLIYDISQYYTENDYLKELDLPLIEQIQRITNYRIEKHNDHIHLIDSNQKFIPIIPNSINFSKIMEDLVYFYKMLDENL